MPFLFRRLVVSISLAFSLLCGGGSRLVAQSVDAVARSARIAGDVNMGQTVRLAGQRPGWATPANDQGELDQSRQLTNLHLVLARSPAVQAAFEQLLEDQQNPTSPRFHQWLTPQQNADQYGLAPDDLQAVTGWLQSRGLHVDEVAAGGVFVTFSGPVSAVQTAFGTSLHNYMNDGATRYAPASEPALPAALAGVVQSVAGLSEQQRYVHSHVREVEGGYKVAAGQKTPFATTTTGNHLLAPGDFNIIYDVNAAQSAGYTGSGYRVVVIIDSTVVASDISAFETFFGVPAGQPTTIVLPGTTSPGVSASEGEADLDVQRIIGTAPGAGVDLLVIPSLTDANIFSALQYEISTLNDAVVNMSFGGCNISSSGPSEASQYSTYYQTAAAQGVTLFNSSGDSGAAGCDTSGTTPPMSQVLATNILCMSQYVTCVGGTEFNDTASPATYWSSTNSSTVTSALSYIPEGAWNEPTQTSGTTTTYVIGATGGGSGYLTKPSWQTGTGVPADGLRDMPDVSFTASDHNGFLICQADISNNCASGSFKYVIGGTSASSPSMAGIAAMLDQRLGGRQGNINPLLYKLAAATNTPFYDTTLTSSGVTNCTAATPSLCNNSTPGPSSLTGGLSGYVLTAGYDEATGLGSLDVAKFLSAAALGTVTTFTVVPTAAALDLLNTSGSTVTETITLTSVNSFAGAVVLTCASTGSTGTATGTCAVSPTSATLTANGTVPVTLTVTNTTAADAGTLTFTVTGSAATGTPTVVTSTPVIVTVSGPTFRITPASAAPSLFSATGGTITDGLTVTAVNGFSGTVALSCKVASATGTAAGTCGFPTSTTTSVALSAGTTASSTLTISSSSVGGSGTLTVIVTGTSGTTTATSTITVTVTAPSISLTPTNSSLTTTSGTTTSTTITVSPAANFTGTVALSCTLSVSSAAYQPTCAVSPASVTVGSTGTTSATLTISSTTARSATATQLTGSVGRRAVEGGAALALLACCVPLRKRRQAFGALAVLCLSAAGFAMLSGCSDSGTATIPTLKSSAGTYTATVTGVGTTTGGSTSVTTSTTVTVTIN